MSVTLEDVQEAAERIADAGANVMEVSHERAFGRVPLREAQVEFVLATRGAEHFEALCGALRAAGHAIVLPDAGAERT